MAAKSFRIERFQDDPLIPLDDPECLENDLYGYPNINGPSVVRVPEWVENSLGRYYLYFSHHKGTFIRMAYADSVGGPYTLYKPGVLHLKDSKFVTDASKVEHVDYIDPKWRDIMSEYAKTDDSHPYVCHIASPDVVIDEDRRLFVMTFHGFEGKPMTLSQLTRVATSADGINFESMPDVVGEPYMRHFLNPFDPAHHYYFAMPGQYYKSSDGLTNYVEREASEEVASREGWLYKTMRHSATWSDEKYLYIFYSEVGTQPEGIVVTTFELDADWFQWKIVGRKQKILLPELEWEGVKMPNTKSEWGELYELKHQIHDPYVFQDADGQMYLFYVGGGESNIGVVKLFVT